MCTLQNPVGDARLRDQSLLPSCADEDWGTESLRPTSLRRRIRDNLTSLATLELRTSTDVVQKTSYEYLCVGKNFLITSALLIKIKWTLFSQIFIQIRLRWQKILNILERNKYQLSRKFCPYQQEDNAWMFTQRFTMAAIVPIAAGVKFFISWGKIILPF